MKKPKRIGYIFGLTSITLLLAYIFWTESEENEKMYAMSLFSIVVLFVFFGYWRGYQIYKLEKLQKLHKRIDYIDYLNNMDIVDKISFAVVPLPILKKLHSQKENEHKRWINISTFMIYLLFVLVISAILTQ